MNDENQWVKRDDVYYKGVVAAVGSDWLNPLAGGGKIGPELGFGHVVGDFIDEPVLLLKTSQGNRALGWDFLPPGSERYEYDGWPTVTKMTSYILEADQLTGPWKMVAYMKDFGEQAYFLNLPSKFISEDGPKIWLSYSANFATEKNGLPS